MTAPRPTSPLAAERMLARLMAAAGNDDPGAADWLAKAWQGMLDGEAFEVAAGMCPTWRADRIRAERDGILVEIWGRWFPTLRPDPAAREIHRRALRYAASAWPREAGTFPTHRVDTLEADLWRLLQADDSVLSADRIRKILKLNDNLWAPGGGADAQKFPGCFEHEDDATEGSA